MRTATTLVVALALVAGCLGPAGPGGNGTPAETATSTETTDGEATTTETTDGEATTTETTDVQATDTPGTDPDGSPSPTGPGTATAENTVAYENLSDRQQAAVRDAIDGSVRFVPDSPYVSDSEGYPEAIIDPFRENDYVRYEGTRYEISFSAGELYASYGIEATPAAPGDDDTVVTLDELPEDVREAVREAVESGDYYAPPGKWDSLPAPLSEADYVRYENETYRLSYAVGDSWAPVMRLSEA